MNSEAPVTERPAPAWRGRLGYFLRNGPLAILSSSLPGLINYVAIVYLTYVAGLEAAGEYRLLFSYFAICGLFALQEASNVYVRANTLGRRDQMGALVLASAQVTLLTVLLLLAAYGVLGALDLPWLPPVIIVIAGVSLFYYPTELFKAHLQSEQRFGALLAATLVKWTATLLAFIVAFELTRSVAWSLAIQLTAMAVLNLIIFWSVAGRGLAFDRTLLNPLANARRPEVRESAWLSFGLLPGLIEQVDKLLVGWIFGLEALGIYTLGFSSGRLLFNAVKPSLYVYYRHFVSRMPPARLLRLMFLVFTGVGALLAAAYAGAIQLFPALAPFRGTEWVATVLFLSYGVAIVDGVYSQAYAINKDTDSRHVFWGATLSSLPCLALFAIAAQMPVQIGLVLFACFYPLRHGAAVALLRWQRRRAGRRAAA